MDHCKKVLSEERRMRRREETSIHRLRRLARALVRDSDAADALVVDTLSATEGRSASQTELFTLLIARRRAQDAEAAQPARATPRSSHPQPDITRALESLSLGAREVLALAVIEQLPYGEAAKVLQMPVDAFMARLTEARDALLRAADGERRVVLRLVK